MKAVLKFNLPEDNFKHETACKADNMWLVIRNMHTHLNKTIDKMKDSEEFSDLAITEMEEVRETFLNELSNSGLDNLIFNY